jgi:chemotaxis response regulator CheB
MTYLDEIPGSNRGWCLTLASFCFVIAAAKPELQVVGGASDGREAGQKVVEMRPDLILLGIGLRTLNDFETARQSSCARPGI